MFMLDGNPLAADTPFTHNEIQYPANWLRLATADEKAAIGIVEVADPETFDDRYYWGVGQPKDFASVKEMFKQRLSQTAYSLLKPTDYKLVRKVETGEDLDAAVLTYRTAVRTAFSSNNALLEAATTVDELAALQFKWPESNA